MTSPYDLLVSYMEGKELKKFGFAIDSFAQEPLGITNTRPTMQGASPTGDYSARDSAPPYPVYWGSFAGGADQENGDAPCIVGRSLLIMSGSWA